MTKRDDQIRSKFFSLRGSGREANWQVAEHVGTTCRKTYGGELRAIMLRIWGLNHGEADKYLRWGAAFDRLPAKEVWVAIGTRATCQLAEAKLTKRQLSKAVGMLLGMVNDRGQVPNPSARTWEAIGKVSPTAAKRKALRVVPKADQGGGKQATPGTAKQSATAPAEPSADARLADELRRLMADPIIGQSLRNLVRPDVLPLLHARESA